ncbi:MAG: ferrous iron transport protein A [Epsilonproteobacteria bacterium]|nr:ferrous iron transport protein A [Campylobacterota bacterium]
MRLSDAKVGDLVKIKGFEAECEQFRRRLEALGVRVGDVVEVKSKAFLGPIEIRNDETDLALCRGQAKKIRVKPLDAKRFD